MSTTSRTSACQLSSPAPERIERAEKLSMATYSEPITSFRQASAEGSGNQTAFYESRSATIAEPYLRFHAHRNSLSSSSGSTSSSPTTTASLMGSSSRNETPGTSPDTAAYSQPGATLSTRNREEIRGDIRAPPTPNTRKARNLKNLALNTTNPLPFGRASLSGALPIGSPTETPVSPTPLSSDFVRPTSPPRRKASALGLTIMTPAQEAVSPAVQPLHQVPQTAKLVRPAALRTFQSSPSVHSLSAGLPRERRLRLPSLTSNISYTVPEQENEQNQNYDAPESREEMPAAYPEGPICIYEPHVWLYLEPSAKQAADYDVIFNVASEVQNPFKLTPKDEGLHGAAVTAELLDAADVPEPIQRSGKGPPEYIHIPWEHNTDIVPDLHTLVKVVDERVDKGKRVLIHCQCGVSRSASLIVAYGLYKNPAMTVQQAYDAVKQRSKWIGPNMNLIMQLQEFRTGLIKSNINAGSLRQGPQEESAKTAPLPQFKTSVPAPIQTERLEIVSPGPTSAPCDFRWLSIQPSPKGKPTPFPTSCVDAAGQVLTLGANVPLSKPATIVGVLTSDAPAPLEQPTIVRRNSASTRAPKQTGAAGPSINSVGANNLNQSLPFRAFADLALSSLHPSGSDPSFGVTSPRTTTFAGASVNERSLLSQPLSSPRGETFAMTALQPLELSDTATLGLTSPRTFTLPDRSILPRVSQFHPSRSNEGTTTRNTETSGVSALAAASQDSLEALASPRALEFTHDPFASLPTAQVATEQESFMDILLSPRATEFTHNPFADVLAPSERATASTAVSLKSADDPRSPRLRRGDPIARDIFDVL